MSAKRMGMLRIVLVLGVLEGFGPLSMDLYLPVLPQLAQSIGTSDSLAQVSMSSCMIGLGIGQLIAGPLSDHFGRKKPLLVGVTLFTVFSVVCAIAPSIEVLLVARLLQGFAGSAGVVISMAIARDLFHGVELSRVLSLLALVTALAPILAPVLGGQLALIMDWRGIFLVLAAIGAALILVAKFGVHETLGIHDRHVGPVIRGTASNMSTVFRDRLFLGLMLVSSFGGIAFFSYLSMSSFVMQDEYRYTPQLFSLIFAINALSQLCGAQISRMLVGRFGVASMYLTGLIAGATVAIVLFAVTLTGAPAPAFATLLALYLAAGGLGGPNGNTLALGNHGSRAGTASALLGVSMFGIGAIAAPAISALFGTSALTLAATIAAASATAAILGILVVRAGARNGAVTTAATIRP